MCIPLLGYGQADNLYFIEDTNFLSYLQENHPQTIVNDSLDIDATQDIDNLQLNNLGLVSLDGVQFFSDLTYLNCDSNQLSTLPILPEQLTDLWCKHNEISSLPELPESLTLLWCSDNQLNSLPTLPEGLINLGCDQNLLTSMPNLPAGLTTFYCDHNQLSNLPILPNALSFFNCSYNQLTTIPALPNSLIELSCFNNQISVLPELPLGLMSLLCYSNLLSTLPLIPQSLTYFSCYNNLLTSLPTLPLGITYLNCSENQLIRLPELPEGLYTLVFNNNPIECVTNYLQQFPNLNDYSLCDEGCTDTLADNYNPEALTDDGSCQYYGCIDGLACNYDPDANFDDGSCVFAQTYYNCAGICINDSDGDAFCDELEIYGCTDSTAINYLDNATEDDGSCILFIIGCGDNTACNWNPEVNISVVDSCIYAEMYYDCSGTCINDSDGNGLCDEVDSIGGCMSEVSLNYNEIANFDDGSCVFEFNVSFDFITSITGIASIYNIYADNLILGTSQIVLGDLIGVFYLLDGVLVSGGHVVYDGTVPIGIGVIGDDPTTLEVEGFQEGQEVVWIVHQVETETNFLIISNTEAEVFSPNTEADVVLYQVNPFVYLGCRDSIACNYNPNANLDDGSCNYPEPYQDCNGICYNDIDLDGVCDEVDYDDGIGIDELKHETPKLTKIVDVLGRTQVNYVKGLILIELYDDGSAVKRIVFD